MSSTPIPDLSPLNVEQFAPVAGLEDTGEWIVLASQGEGPNKVWTVAHWWQALETRLAWQSRDLTESEAVDLFRTKTDPDNEAAAFGAQQRQFLRSTGND